jgi:hypothetical protein
VTSLFISITLDPRGVYVGCTSDFKLFFYVPDRGMWYPIDISDGTKN